MNLRKATITSELTKLNLALNARRSIDELKLLADIWWVDCQHMLENRFIQALSVCRKHSKWFPTPAEINEQYEYIVANLPEPELKQIDQETLSPAEERTRLGKIRELLNAEPTMYISEKYKPDNPVGKNIVYVPEPFLENKRRMMSKSK